MKTNIEKVLDSITGCEIVGLLVKINFFEFALKLGVIFTYLIIQSMRYCQQDNQTSTHVHKINSKLRDENMLKYIRSIMNPLSLIFAFHDLYAISSRLKEHKLIEVITNERDKKLYEEQLKIRPSILELHEGKFEESEGLFQETFPDMYTDLEKIRKNIPNEIEARQQSIKEKMKKIRDHPNIKRVIQLEKEDPNHTKCDGELLPDTRKNSKNKNVRKCSKCLRWVPVKRVKKGDNKLELISSW
jgi:hypothetical protein